MPRPVLGVGEMVVRGKAVTCDALEMISEVLDEQRKLCDTLIAAPSSFVKDDPETVVVLGRVASMLAEAQIELLTRVRELLEEGF